MIRALAICVAVVASASSACASAVGAFEDFNSSSADWWNAANSGPIGWSSSGGPDGGAFATTTFNFLPLNSGDTPILMRANNTQNASGGIFFGDYITSGVSELRFWVRHDGPGPLSFFARFTASFGGPGAIVLDFTPVQSGVWTELTVSLDASNPFLILEGVSYESVFSDVGRLQVGLTVDDTLGNWESDVHFGLDKVELVPTPGAAATLLLAGLCGASRRRR